MQQYIQQQFAQWGTVSTHEFWHQGQTHQNLILNFPGTTHAEALVIVGAHYDAVPGSPGADDNATGVAVLLELARAIAQHPPRHPIQLVAFDLEESGLIGSRHYAQMLKQQQQKIRLMLSLEMLGYRDSRPGTQKYPPPLERFYPDRGDYIGLIGNWPTLFDLIHLKRYLRQADVSCEWLLAGAKGQIVPSTRLSDHASFWDQGYRAAMVTDTAFLRNPHYHQASDRIETLDLDFLTGSCAGLIKGICQL